MSKSRRRLLTILLTIVMLAGSLVPLQPSAVSMADERDLAVQNQESTAQTQENTQQPQDNAQQSQEDGQQTQENAQQSQENTQQPQDNAQQNSENAGQQADTQPDPMEIYYSAYLYGVGWTPWKEDNTLCQAPAGSYVTALKAGLINQVPGMTGTLIYQVNLSGYGWLDWAENGAPLGGEDGDAPLEAVRLNLTGQLAENYDVYYTVFQNGAWTPWAMNGESAGQEGVSLRVDGIRASVVSKGSGEPADPVSLIDPDKPMIALTFDDGPNAAVTNRILASLEANGGRATFFMVGNRVSGQANIASVQKMAELGCEVANHTYEHKTITKLGAAGIQSQLAKTNEIINRACAVSPVLMRPPGGAKNEASLKVVGDMGMASIMWSIDTLDWKTRNAQKTVDAVLNHVKDGDIVLMHDLYTATADAAEIIIPELIRRGYQLVTVSEMASYRGGIVPGHSYSSFRP